MQDTPLVSIVITAYNDEATIHAAIGSALVQSWPNCEIIVVLDGPTDGTAAAVETYRDRVHLIHKENGGTASARNAGIAAAKGEWIQFLDADDILLPDKITVSMITLAGCANRDHVAMLYSGYYRMDEHGNLFALHKAEPYLREKLLAASGHVTPNPMLRTRCLKEVGGYSSAYIYAEDTEMYHRLAVKYAGLAVDEPLFLYRSSPTQKSTVMRQHEKGNLIALEPQRIRETYAPLFNKHQPTWTHPVGALASRGALDIGLHCPHSCVFCYYSYLDGSDDQFSGMRNAPFKSTAECRRILEGFHRDGLSHFDVTGGEPTRHPDIVSLVRYARHDLNLKARIITLGMYLMRARKRGGPLLIDELLAAGLDDLLLSVHAVDPELFKRITGGSYARLKGAMDYLDDIGFSYCTNTLIFEGNFMRLPEIAAEIAHHNVRIANLIVMNTYHEWNKDGRGVGVQARYRDIHPYLTHACRILEEVGIGVNIRYGPYCAYKGLEKHFVGVMGVELDPYEWRNVLKTGQLKHRSVASFLATQRQQLDNPHSMFTKVYDYKCRICRMRLICDGVDRKYISHFGWNEFEPYPMAPGEKPISNPLLFRYDNPLVFWTKAEDETAVVQYALGKLQPDGIPQGHQKRASTASPETPEISEAL